MKYSPADISKLGTILGIWAHPDDEAWMSGGIMATACQNGQRVIVATATHGEAGKTANPDRWPQAELRTIRAKELNDSLDALGVTEHHWLDYADGELADVDPNEAVQILANLIGQTKPDTILTFAPDGLTGHPDHKTICQWAVVAAETADSDALIFGAIESEEKYQAACKDCPSILQDIYFKTRRPTTEPMNQTDLCFELPKDIQEIKRRSLACQPSQTDQLFQDPSGRIFIEQQLGCECFVSL